jgi:hypothetical protein
VNDKDKEAISDAFADMAMYRRGFTRMTADGIKHIPYHETLPEHTCPTCNNKFRGADERFCPECHAKAHDGNPV